jgi:hypothetical protein
MYDSVSNSYLPQPVSTDPALYGDLAGTASAATVVALNGVGISGTAPQANYVPGAGCAGQVATQDGHAFVARRRGDRVVAERRSSGHAGAVKATEQRIGGRAGLS